MTVDIGILLAAFFVILGGSLAFTNALEHFGERFALSTGVTGSILAAVGTALPETAVPIVAVITGRSESAREIGVGAILGAPLMLCTLAFFLIGAMAILHRGPRGSVSAETSGLRRDLRFFLFSFLIALGALYVPFSHRWARTAIAFVLVMLYLIYLWRTIRVSRRLVAAGHGTTAAKALYATRLGLPAAGPITTVQLLVGIALIIAGARGFVLGITHISAMIGLSPLFLSLAIVPFATELPEKLNSVIWIGRRQDTLAVGNVSGALVFQSTLLPALGVLLTPWQPRYDVRLAMGITLVTGAWLLVLSRLKRMPAMAFLVNGAAYAAYFYVLLAHSR